MGLVPLLRTMACICASVFALSTSFHAQETSANSAMLRTLLLSATPLSAVHLEVSASSPDAGTQHLEDLTITADGALKRVKHYASGTLTDDTTSGERVITDAAGFVIANKAPLYTSLEIYPLQVLAAQLKTDSLKNIQYVGEEKIFGSPVLHFRIGDQKFVGQDAKMPEWPPREGDADIFLDITGKSIVAIAYSSRTIPKLSVVPRSCFDSSNHLIKPKKGYPPPPCFRAGNTPIVKTILRFGQFKITDAGLLPVSYDIYLQGQPTHYSVTAISNVAK